MQGQYTDLGQVRVYEFVALTQLGPFLAGLFHVIPSTHLPSSSSGVIKPGYEWAYFEALNGLSDGYRQIALQMLTDRTKLCNLPANTVKLAMYLIICISISEKVLKCIYIYHFRTK